MTMTNPMNPSIVVEVEAREYLKANRGARNPKEMAQMSVLSDAQAFVEHNNRYVNYLINVAKFILLMTDDEVQEALQ